MKENDYIENDLFEPKDDKERKKLEFFWDHCSPGEEPGVADSIRARTLRKIREENEQSVPVVRKKSLRMYYLAAASVAASVVLFLGWFLGNEQPDDIYKVVVAMNAVTPEETEDVTLMMSEGDKVQIATDARIAYTPQGAVSVNSESVPDTKQAKNEHKASSPDAYNQVIVPKGKRSQLVLSDGTKIWINSGTKVIYPRVFKGDKRDIYVEGEIYLEVAHDAKKPFWVNTSGFEVKVLGTCFGVFAYKNMEARVVLAEGSVEIKDKHEKSIRMVPDELVSITDEGIQEKIRVNAAEYKAWIDGLMVLNGENLNRLTERLSLYYGEKIVCDSSLYNEQVYGKLDLRDDLNDIIDFIKSMIPLSVREENGVIYLNRE